YAINRAIIDLARNPNARSLNKAEFFAAYPLSDEEREALLGQHWRRLLELGVLPNLVYRLYMLHGLKPESFPAAVKAKGLGGDAAWRSSVSVLRPPISPTSSTPARWATRAKSRPSIPATASSPTPSTTQRPTCR